MSQGQDTQSKSLPHTLLPYTWTQLWVLSDFTKGYMAYKDTGYGLCSYLPSESLGSSFQNFFIIPGIVRLQDFYLIQVELTANLKS